MNQSVHEILATAVDAPGAVPDVFLGCEVTLL